MYCVSHYARPLISLVRTEHLTETIPRGDERVCVCVLSSNFTNTGFGSKKLMRECGMDACWVDQSAADFSHTCKRYGTLAPGDTKIQSYELYRNEVNDGFILAIIAPCPKFRLRYTVLSAIFRSIPPMSD